jgi:hypothetical protein
MACEITLNEVSGLQPPGGGNPVELLVSGGFNLEEGDKACTAIEITVTVDGVVMSGETEVDEDTGEWSISFVAGTHFDPGEIVCDEDAKIDLVCVGDSECPERTFGIPISCRPRDCPNTVVLQLVNDSGDVVPTDQGCVPPAKYRVELVDPILPNNTYQWSIDGADFETPLANQPQSPEFEIQGDEGAVSVGVFIQINSVPGCLASDTLAIDVCVQPGSDCPESLTIELIDTNGNPVQVQDADGNTVPAGAEDTCVPPGTYRGRVPEIADDAIHNWGITGVDFESGPDDESTSPAFTLAEGDSVALSVGVVSFSLNCLPDVDPLLLEACEGEPVDCDQGQSMTVELDLPDGVQAGDCLPPGQYVARVTDPDPIGLSFSWSRGGELVQTSLDPANHPLDGPTLLFELEAGETAELTAATQIGPDCRMLSDGIEAVACDCPRLDLVIVDGDGELVDTGVCVEPGRYTARIRGDVPDGTTFAWRLDGVDQAETGIALDLELPAEGEIVVHVVAELSEDCRFEERERLRACTCPEDLSLSVTDANGAPVTGCVAPGDYVVRVDGEGVSAEGATWNVDGVTVNDAQEVPVTVTPADGVGCVVGGAMGPSVSVTVDGEDGCPDRSAGTLLNICTNLRFNPCCWLWRILILIFAIVTVIGLALALCPQVVVNPLIPQTASLVPAALIAGLIIAGIAGAITLVLAIIWYFLCRPTWCNDWIVLLWQFFVGGGFVFIYFGACPTCGLLPLGIAMMLIGLGLFFIWVGRCNPTLCRIFFEIGTLGLVQVLVGWLEFFLVVCIWQWGWLLQLAFVTFLNFVGWIGTVIACRVNPNG